MSISHDLPAPTQDPPPHLPVVKGGVGQSLWNELKSHLTVEHFKEFFVTKILLPQEITPFEQSYLERTNRLMFFFFLSNIPVFMLVAAIHGTGMLNAVYLSVLALIGPAIGDKVLKNPRHVSMLHGFTAMCMGGVLVHLGQGPMQIEMHFYFFIMLAILAVFANPMVILVAAGTVTVHHLLLYFLLPESIFNYDAPVWVVLVHAAFVVLESVATVYMSRSFFDNVIGLERIVQERTAEVDRQNRDMTLILDNVMQGLVNISTSGVIISQPSLKMSEWFSRPKPGQRLSALIEQKNPTAAMWFDMGIDVLQEDLLPLELCLEQLPSEIEFDGKTLRMEYTPLFDQDVLQSVLVVFTDITAELERERLEQEQREFVKLATRLQEDRAGFLEFFLEANKIMNRITHEDFTESPMEIKRLIHTLKGNAGFFELKTIANLCHELESQIQDTYTSPTREELEQLNARWRHLRKSLSSFLEDAQHSIHISDEEYKDLLNDVLHGTAHERLAERINAWRLEPVQRRLERLAKQADALAINLGKEVSVEIHTDDTRLVPERWRTFWATFVHVMRNALDHGLETPDERLEKGKEVVGRLILSARQSSRRFEVRVKDDGAGINWDKLREKAESLGLDTSSQQALTAALFTDGISTRDEVTQTSGRGVGMAAVLNQCNALGGEISVQSVPNHGTEFIFSFPLDTVAQPASVTLAA